MYLDSELQVTKTYIHKTYYILHITNICKYVVNYVRNIFVSNMQYVFFFYFFIVGFIYLFIYCCMESLISFFFSDRILFYSEKHQIAEVKWVERAFDFDYKGVVVSNTVKRSIHSFPCYFPESVYV